jgi:transposase-like protein
MHSVVSIAAVSKARISYVHCPSCRAKVQEVHGFVTRMTWDRFRCKCGYDGPLEYIASLGNANCKLSNG